MKVRPAVPEDADGINSVRNASWRAAYGAHIPDDYWTGYDSASAIARYVAMISDPRTNVLVAETDAVIGYVFFGVARDDDVTPDTREVYAIYVHPDAWSTGAGRALMAAALEALGEGPVVLWVLESNARARRFYALAGFAPDGAHKPAEMPGGQLPEMRYRRG